MGWVEGVERERWYGFYGELGWGLCWCLIVRCLVPLYQGKRRLTMLFFKVWSTKNRSGVKATIGLGKRLLLG